MTNSSIDLLNQHNEQLRSHLTEMEDRKLLLDTEFKKITSSKHYIYWQKMNVAKRFIKRKLSPKQYISSSVKYRLKTLLRIMKARFVQRRLLMYRNDDGYHPQNKLDRKMVSDLVSVVIPTFNAGKEFETIIKKIVNQKHLSQIEIVVVDSGSSDDTVKIAKRYGAKIIRITPSSFSHSKTRNLGSKTANGRFLIFTVQDAHMLNQYTVCDAINFLQENTLAAVSVRQVPRADADIFSSWQSATFSNFLSPEHSNKVTRLNKLQFLRLSSAQKRAHCTLDDVFVLYEKQVFDSMGGYDETLSYGEDLEMGKRFVLEEKRIGYLFSNGVVHSHNRDASYFVQRFFVDTVFLSKVFNDSVRPYKFSQFTCQDLVGQLIALSKCLENMVVDGSLSVLGVEHQHASKLLSKNKFRFTAITTLQELGNSLGGYDENIALDNDLKIDLDSYLKDTLKGLNSAWLLSGCNPNELAELADKIFAIFCSVQLSNLFLSSSKPSVSTIQVYEYMTSKI